MVCCCMRYVSNTPIRILYNSALVLFWVCFFTLHIVNFERKPKVQEKSVNFRDYVSNGSYNIIDISRPIQTKTLYSLTLFGDYLMNNVSICSSTKPISLLFWIHTSVSNFENRRNIRSTFALRSRYLPEEVRVVFFTGKSANKFDSQRLIQEQQRHGDIVQGDFVDSYHNLTHKAVMALRWIYEHCVSVRHVIKADDDVVFDTRMFFTKMAATVVGQRKTLWCNVCPHSGIYRKGKWKVVPHEFKGYIYWPWPYCAGFVVMISRDLLASLYRAAMISPFFWVDDVYTFGILAKYIEGIKHRQFPFTSRLEEIYSRGEKCLREKKASCNVMAVGAKTNKEFNTIWGLIQDKYKKP